MYDVGDIVLVPRGQETKFFEVIKVEGNQLWISDGRVQIRKGFTEVELICKSVLRLDSKVPTIRYLK